MDFLLGPDKSAYGYLCELPSRLDIANGRIIVAWARQSGVGLLNSALGQSLRNIDIIVGMANRGTSAEALSLLKVLARRVFVYHKHHLQTFHPKVYLLDSGGSTPNKAALLVGSSNLTGGGLFQNIEANLAMDLLPRRRRGDRDLFNDIVKEIAGLRTSGFCEQITDDHRIQQLLDDRYISSEQELQQRRRREGSKAARRGERRLGPEAPPPRLPAFSLPSVEVTFKVPDGEGIDTQSSSYVIGSYSASDPSDQFYVRTLTANDVNKLHNATPGTAEWDIGITARDMNPVFWGWPDNYKQNTRIISRLEWATTGHLQTSVTGNKGISVEVMLWYREPRPGHAAEHRLRIGPRNALVGATPADFDTNSLLVVERLPVGHTHTFLIQMLTPQDPEYKDHLPYLTYRRPQHRFGYGP